MGVCVGQDLRDSFRAAGVAGYITGCSVHIDMDSAVRFEIRGLVSDERLETQPDWPRFLRAVANQLEGKGA